MPDRWEKELNTAMEAAWEAGRLTLRWFQAAPDVDLKADGSPVTDADRGAEEMIRRIVRARFPDDGVMGEEYGEEPGRSGRRWIIDPIDGTRSFVHGVPLYGVMVALEADGQPVASAVSFPPLGELVAAARGLGCRWNGRPCRVSGDGRLERALVLTSGDAPAAGRAPDPGATDDVPVTDDAVPAVDVSPVDRPAAADPDLDRRLRGLRRLAAAAATFRTWGDAYGYALVATGRAQVMLDPVVQVWDTAAVRPMIEEAGGVFTDWWGQPSHTAGHSVGTNRALADAVRRELDRAGEPDRAE